MKKTFTLFLAVLLTASVLAQSPEKMSYQAVIRNSSDALVTNTQVGMQISILQGTTDGTVVYAETQTHTTNANGLVSIEIGTGNTSDDFTTIDWANGPYYIKTETDPSGGTNYTITGTNELMSVPYALYAKTAENGITTVQADAITANTAKVGITAQQATDITANNAKVGYSDALVSANADVVANTAKVGITAQQATDITANNAKVGYSDALVSANADVVANTAKVGITAQQATDITANNAKVGYSDALVSANADVVANTAKVGITAQQATDITANNAKVGYSDALVSANADVVANNAKVGYSDALVSANADVVANTAKVGITAQQATDITANNAKVGYSDALVSANADVVANTAKVGITNAQADAITTNTAKVSYPAADATKLAGIATGAEVNVQVDWNQATTTADDYIKNKPTIPTAADGSETKITAGTNVTVTGSGTTASPYVINSTSDGGSTHYLGEEYLGGIIFYLYTDATGTQKGLIVSKTETTATWSGSNLVGADRTEDGAYNMNVMPAASPARLWVEALGAGWYLPSIDELSILWHNRFHVNKTARAVSSTLLSTTAFYWSSTEQGTSFAYTFRFASGYLGSGNKDDVFGVRAVRAF